MVSKIALLIILSLTAQAATPDALVIVWQGSEIAECKNLVDSFLTELRTLASDRSIELESGQTTLNQNHGKRTMALNCQQSRPSQLQITDLQDGQTLSLRYLRKAQAFDAVDWLPFQKRFLRPNQNTEAVDLAPHPHTADRLPAEQTLASSTAEADVTHGGTAIYQKWWFWAALVGVGAGVFGIVQMTKSDSANRINVEIR